MDLAALVELAGLVAPDLPEVVDRARLAARDPATYRGRFPDDSWVADEDDQLPLVAVVNALVGNQRIAVIDWRASPDETLAAFAGVLDAAHQELRVWTDGEAVVWNVDDPATNGDTTPDRLIARIAGRLAQHDLRCINLGGGSDTYCLALVPQQSFERSLACARSAGFSEHLDLADEARAAGRTS